MNSKLIDGKEISSSIKNKLKSEIDEINDKYSRVPSLVVVLVGKNPATPAFQRA